MLTNNRAAIIDKLENEVVSQDIALAFMYCKYNFQDSHTLENLLGSLLRQLLQYSSSVPAEVRTIFENHSSHGTRTSKTEYLSTLASLVTKWSRVFLVVDALDECHANTRLELIEDLQNLPRNISLLFTSRQLGDIEEAFQHASRLEIRASQADVSQYLRAKISEEQTLKRFCKEDPDLETAIVERVVEKADGMSVMPGLIFFSFCHYLSLIS